jgi:hypothetical protein
MLNTVASFGRGIRHMKEFHSGREAKEFLISKIVAEAHSKHVPLSEVERKMLCFTESGWTLPDIMRVSEDFDREYDRGEYEQKIAKLVAETDRSVRRGSREDYDRWWAAIRFLQREDHYLSVMVRLAALRPRGDQLRLLVAGIGIATCILMCVFPSIKYNVPMFSRGNMGIVVWSVLACLFVVYVLLRFIIGAQRTDDLTSTVLEKLVRIHQRFGGTA